jgi:beta-lactamase regulating signal transducer with metallopeptidase domain/UDP-N-acetylglucosamine transferase subunit ALG13
MIERALIEYVLNALWQVPLLAGGAWLLLRMVRPSPLIQHHIWLAVLGLAVLLPVHGMDSHRVSATQQTAAIIEASHEEVPGPPALNELPRRHSQWFAFGPLFSARTGNLRLTTRTAHWLLRLYVATIVIGLFRITRAWLGARTLVQNSQATCLGDRDRAVLEDYSRRLGINPPQLRESGEVSSPMIVGGRAPVLLLPTGFAWHTENEIRAALCHELAHIQRRDYLLNVACQVAALPLAWHPVVDWVQKRIRMTREMVCDAMAAQEMKSHLGYAKCLLALAHSMLGERAMAAQAQFLGLFGNHTLEERVMRLMDTTTMSVRAKAVRVVSGAAMMISTGAIAGMFHVTPTMAQANVPPQAPQNSPAEAQAPVPAPTASSPSVAAPPDTAPAVPKKHTYVHRNEGDGESRESTLTEQPLIDKDVQQQTDDLWSQMAEDMAKANTADFKQRMEDAQQQIADAMTKFNNTESKRRMDDLRSELAEDMAKTNTPEFKQRMEDAQRQMAEATAKFNSPEFKQRMDDLRSRMAEDMAKANTPEFQKRMEDAQRQMADAAAKFNSPEFRQKMDDLQQQLEQQMEEFNRRAAHSPNP